MDVTDGGARITGGWSAEQQVLTPSLLVAAVAVGVMFVFERMF